jgi:hypothetical protein
VGVNEIYEHYLQSENYRGMKDIPLAYRRMVIEMEIALDRKKNTKRVLEIEKHATELALVDLRK